MRRLTLAVAALAVASCSPGGGSSARPRPDDDKSPPCHPGCFPAGTPIETPAGPRPVEAIQVGDEVTLVGPDGAATAGPVRGVYRTTNELVEVRTEAGVLRTTATQPLSRANGGFWPAGELTPGAVLWRWAGGRRQTALVTAVVPLGRAEPVFNLVVGDGVGFVAGGIVARGKPPAEAQPDPGR